MKTAEQIAKSWFHKAEQEQDVFDKFVAFWFAFNSLYSKHFEGNERDAIKDFIYKEYHHKVAIPQINAILKSESAKFFCKRIIRDMKRRGNDTTECAKKLANENNSPKHRLKSLFMILYQVRCNLFHGNKLYERDSDTEVISNAQNILHQFLKQYINRAIPN